MSKSRYGTYMGNILDLMSGLDLSNNELTGQIPSQMGHLNSIFTLNLCNNYLTGPIPETFSNLEQIESLDPSCNGLSGHIPSQLTGLYYLSVFSMAHNNLSRSTPERVKQFATFEASSYEENSNFIIIMGHFDSQQEAPAPYTPAMSVPPPVSVEYPTKDGSEGDSQQDQTTSRGDGFWKGCICLCVLPVVPLSVAVVFWIVVMLNHKTCVRLSSNFVAVVQYIPRKVRRDLRRHVSHLTHFHG
ncbi:Tyrosine-sulfated glycopeptide receptor 1 [Spatholobus suberectus]|nr:Tyrosine-sulfated glycopeptide receptor 1 [Spatholobus suberectus]